MVANFSCLPIIYSPVCAKTWENNGPGQTMKTQIRLLIEEHQGLHKINGHSVCIRRYRKVPKFSDTRKLCCNLPKIQTKRQKLLIFRLKDTNGIANSEDPDQTAPLGSALFAQNCLSKNLGSLRYLPTARPICSIFKVITTMNMYTERQNSCTTFHFF